MEAEFLKNLESFYKKTISSSFENVIDKSNINFAKIKSI